MNVRELKYILLGDDRLSRVMGNVSQSTDKATASLDRQSTKLNKLRDGAKNAAAEIPAIGGALSKIASPAALIGTAIGGIGMAIRKANQEAAAFNNTFLDIEQINLDKSAQQLDKLKGRVLDLAYKRGFNAQKTAVGTFDVQSITGKYGAEVEVIVDKVGQFAQMMKADFNKSISGASQAMEIFGFGVSKMDKFLESSYKTVLVGKTTFDQLAQVQVEYAGAAASAGQDFNAANKVFAVFSKNAKSVDIAATLTKTAFQDLAKGSTIKGLKTIGVSLFDAENRMLSIDEILKQLVPRLKGMDDVRFAKLKEDIGGSEGLRALLDMAKNSGDSLLNTFKSFDDAEFDKGKALANALKDAATEAEILTNKLDTAWAKFGQRTVGIANFAKKFAIGSMETIGQSYQILEEGLSTLGLTVMGDYEGLKAKRAEKFDRIEDVGKSELFKEYAGLMDDARSGKWDRAELVKQFAALEDKRSQLLKQASGKSDSELMTGWDDTKKASFFTGQANAIQELKGMLQQAYFEGGEKTMTAAAAVVMEDPTASAVTSKTPDPVRKGIDAISGGGAVRNVNVTVQKFTDEVNINSSTVTEGTSQIMDILGEYFIRMIQGAETAVQTY